MNIAFCVAHLRALQTDCGEGSAGTFEDCLLTDVGLSICQQHIWHDSGEVTLELACYSEEANH